MVGMSVLSKAGKRAKKVVNELEDVRPEVDDSTTPE